MKIKKGDTVQVISGKERGKSGVVKLILKDKQRVVVEGLNMIKRHKKASAQGEPSGIIEMEGPIHISNIMILDPKTNKPTRVGFKIKDGKKVRIAKKSKSVIK